MAISIDWGTRVITVPKADLTLIDAGPPEIRELDLNDFHLWLRAAEWDPEGMPFLDTHNHNTEVLLGGVTYARIIEIINGYTVTFEDGQYVVNLVGANSNVLEVTNANQVSVRAANSAGLINVITPTEIAAAVWDAARTDHVVSGSFGEWVGRKLLTFAKYLGAK